MNERPTHMFEPLAREGLRYCAEVAPIPRLMIRIDPDGRLMIKGQRAEIEALVEALGRQGVAVSYEYLSFCG